MLYFSRWKTITIWAVVLLGVFFAIPNMLPQSVRDSLPGWLPDRPMTLGLDLQGGSHILLAVDRNDLVNERLQTVRDDIRTMLRDAKIGYTGLSGTGRAVQVRIREANEVEKAKEALETLTQPVTNSLFGAGAISELTLDEPEPGLLRFTLTDEGIDYRMASAVDAIHRGDRAARQRTRHHRADHPAPGRRPRSRSGAGPPGPAAPQGYSRTDSQADLPDGRSVDARPGRDPRTCRRRERRFSIPRTIRPFLT